MYDHLIIGAGVAGLSLAYRIAHRGKTLVLEGEAQPGYHSSGRSAAMFMETYGTPVIRALTRASRPFFFSPPAGFAEHPLVGDRGVLYLARTHQAELLKSTFDELQATGADVRLLSPEQAVQKVPCIDATDLLGAIEERDAKDVDVHALMQGYLKGAREQGCAFQFCVHATGAVWNNDHWSITLSNQHCVQARRVVNAAGAWAGQVAELFGAQAIGLQPKRRSAFTFKPVCADTQQLFPDDQVKHWPAVVGIDESFYFKPDAGQLLGSPANADPVPAHDVVAEEFDVALGIDRITTATRLSIRRPTHTWAGLRSFVPDGDFVVGADANAPAFFWLAALGGYGIQTSPAASLLASNLLLGEPLDALLVEQGVEPDCVSPARFAQAS